MAYEYVEAPIEGAKIKVIGVGGGGGNALNSIADTGIIGNVDYIAINTDIQALKNSKAQEKIQIGPKQTHGLGAGAKPEVGEASAIESQDDITEVIKDADMVFITAGMGGGTGTGAAPVVAKIAHDMEKLTIAVVSKPFRFEGAKKMEKAEQGIAKMLENVDALIVIPNQNLLATGQKLTMKQSYALSDEVLKTDVISIAEIITRHDEINVDFADITTIIKDAGFAHMAIGHGQGKDKVPEVVAQVIKSDLLETSVAGAKRLLVNITMSEDIVVDEIDELTQAITEAVDEDAEIIFGNGYDGNMNDEVYVTVIAADFDGSAQRRAEIQEKAASQPLAEALSAAAAARPKAEENAKEQAEANHRAGVKAADNPTYYDDIFNIFKSK
ncbi:cell division protein FtsZ [Ruminococcus sp. YE71]|uniref:cell division protein FtsZ n=1 Tax=unclassified Ruminococcus TaxID=2608920 RepID=UPI000888C4E8|nr:MULTISPECIES: cell division protein FtsZ [unclassified Ruminococcus]SDA11951.1 cell division protein FtsZ [Ruminococcus sp. YE78]SFW15993.1 cell division protein FtsZ [Ruminococcus sp. YE71]